MNENSSFKSGKMKLINIEDDEILKSNQAAPLLEGQKSEKENAMVFKVYDPKTETNNTMAFQKKKKKSNKD